MQKRTASVNHILVHGITFSGIFNIGDTESAQPKSRGIAVQKEGATFIDDEGLDFKDFSLFHREANWPTVNESIIVRKKTINHTDKIQVGNISALGVSQASILQIGSIEEICAEARIKHFRQYLPE
ncbi:spore germination protein GerPE [Virgibacillus sp. L01]|uniref:spore germination protein GerPE n=1 Tax=Virgibacillus sp. L01 TaxID=3457429 RepID=UPI003FD506DB